MWRLSFIITCINGICYNISERYSGKPKAPLLKLNDGNCMPSLAFGTWLGAERQIPGEETLPQTTPVTSNSTEKAVGFAIDVGFRHIDTAALYLIEDQVGRAIKNKVAEGVVKREDLFITTKLWNDRHASSEVVPALRESLSKLDLDYVDLYLVHFPISTFSNLSVSDIDYLETWKGMIEAKNLGLAKSIGVSNFNRPQLDRLMRHSEVKPAVLQIEVNLNIQQDCLREYAKKHGIIVTGYTPFGSLFPSTTTALSPPPRVDDAELALMAKKYGKTVPQLTLRYLYERGVVPIPKAESKSHIEQNFDILDFQLEEQDKRFLKDFDRNYKTLNIAFWKTSPYYPF